MCFQRPFHRKSENNNYRNAAPAAASAFAFVVYQLIVLPDGRVALIVPPGPKYHVWAVVPGTGKPEKYWLNPGYGLPGVTPPSGAAST